MTPYWVLYVKRADRMQAVLQQIEFLRDNIIPKLTARDPHELRLAHEAKSMVLHCEMKLKASLFRTESRWTHYREDYPMRDDPSWLAWVKIKDDNGIMTLSKEPRSGEMVARPLVALRREIPNSISRRSTEVNPGFRPG